MRRLPTLALALFVGLGAGCSDQLTTPLPRTFVLDPAMTVLPTGSLDAEITALSNALFPKGLETAAGTRWENVKAKYDAGVTDPAQMKVAEQMLFELGRWVKSKTSQMETPPNGESRDAAAARLVTYMALYVYQGPTTVVPPYNPGADAVVAFVSPTDTATITTPAGYAGVGVEAGSVSESAIITITQNPQQYPENCTGPLQTSLCQYPLFYDFHVFPVQKFLKSVHTAVCHLSPAGTRGPLDDPQDPNETVHTRLRLAHTLPADPANYTPGATQLGTNGENIEILQLSTSAVSSGVDCTAPTNVAMGPLGRVLNGFASALGRALTPAPLYAVDQGPEHDVDFFSPFNLLDPQSAPDLSVGSASAQGTASSSPSETLAGETMAVSYTVFNTSPVNGGAATATSAPTDVTIHLSGDGVLDPGDVLLATTGVGALPPDSSESFAGVAVVIPAGTPPGPQTLLIHAVPAGPLAEASTANNLAAVAIDVVLPSTGAETTDMQWATTSDWHEQASGLTNALYPLYVGAADGDNSLGALPAPFTGSRSWWYGGSVTGSYIGTQDPGDVAGSGGLSVARHSGTLSSPVFVVPAGHSTTVSYKSWFEIESVDAPSFDLMLVYFEPAGGAAVQLAKLNPTTDYDGPATTPVTSGGFNSPPVWETRSVSLSAFAGQAGRILFHFNTGDRQYNGYRGWIIDDVVVTAVPSTFIASVSPSFSISASGVLPVMSTSFSPELTFPPRQ